MNIDELSPAYVGEDRITLSVDEATPAFTYRAVQINVDYSRCEPEGVVLPLDFIVQGPTDVSYVEVTIRSALPTLMSFSPIAAGRHLVLLREQAHNRWFGRLIVDVKGDPFEKV